MVPKSWVNSTIYPKVNYFLKIEDHINLENGIWIFKTYFIIEPFSVVVYDNYQYIHQAASRFMGGGMQSNLIVFGIN